MNLIYFLFDDLRKVFEFYCSCFYLSPTEILRVRVKNGQYLSMYLVNFVNRLLEFLINDQLLRFMNRVLFYLVVCSIFVVIYQRGLPFPFY